MRLLHKLLIVTVIVVILWFAFKHFANKGSAPGDPSRPPAGHNSI